MKIWEKVVYTLIPIAAIVVCVWRDSSDGFVVLLVGYAVMGVRYVALDRRVLGRGEKPSWLSED